MRKQSKGRRIVRAGVAAGIALGLAAPATAQWTQVHEQFYLPASHNWVFRQNYSNADRLFNAFDYGHAILYEELYRRPEGPVERLEVDRYEFLTERLLRRPPRVPLEEGAIEIAYAKIAPEAKNMFHWAHILHRQLYDVLADERLDRAEKDAAVAEVVAYYKSRPEVAFSSIPKSMDIMDGQPYSLVFRQRYPKFNGLIWAYHWLQVGLYEPLVVNDDVASRTTGVNATVGRFWQMLENAPATMPYLMPMTAAVAPTFAERYPEAAIIFDNLHMMHDVISDILASPLIPREQKRAEILRVGAMFRDDTSYATTVDEWKAMTGMMGLNNMGGPAVGFLTALPEPSVPRGMSMAGMDHVHGAPGEDARGQQGGGGMPAEAQPQPGMQHGGMDHAMPDRPVDGGQTQLIHELQMRLLADPIVRERVRMDPELSRMVEAMEETMEPADAPDSGGAVPHEPERMLDLIVRLLADPAVEARIHADPRLHQLWSDPEIQRRLEARRGTPAPAMETTPAHQH